MSDTKVLLQKIAALRQRLEKIKTSPRIGEGNVATMPPALALKNLNETLHNGMDDTKLLQALVRSAEPLPSIPTPPPQVRLTARAIRVLQRSRELVQTLRTLADEPILRHPETRCLADLHGETSAMLDVIPRLIPGFPVQPSDQMRLCDGLEGILASVDDRIGRIQVALVHRRRDFITIDSLADFLRNLANGHDVDRRQLQNLAEDIVDDAGMARPLRFFHASPEDPARYAAAHSHNVAQVLIRVLLAEGTLQYDLTLAAMSALLHDIGMVKVPAEILIQNSPLNDEQRRLVEQHTIIAGPLVQPLFPGGGWPIEGVTDHHERIDGTGYPRGRKEIQISNFAKLMGVCDIYAALCVPRSHRSAFDTRTAMTDVLMMAERDHLDRVQAEKLLALSFYPPGTVVELNDGAVAVVVATHPGAVGMANPARPIIELLTDGDRQPLALPRVLDLLHDKSRSILRGMSGEDRKEVLGRTYPELV